MKNIELAWACFYSTIIKNTVFVIEDVSEYKYMVWLHYCLTVDNVDPAPAPHESLLDPGVCIYDLWSPINTDNIDNNITQSIFHSNYIM